jgi:hypothetical protein
MRQEASGGLRSEQGFSLLPVLALLTFLAATSIHLFSKISEEQTGVNYDRLMTERTVFEIELRNKALYGPILYASIIRGLPMGQNAALKACLFDDFDAVNDCSTDFSIGGCTGALTIGGVVWCPIDLYEDVSAAVAFASGSGSTSTNPSGSPVMSGGAGVGSTSTPGRAPASQSSSGAQSKVTSGASAVPAAANSNFSHFRAASYFHPVCAAGATSCTQALSIDVRYLVTALNDSRLAPVEVIQSVVINDGKGHPIVPPAATPAPPPPPAPAPVITASSGSGSGAGSSRGGGGGGGSGSGSGASAPPPVAPPPPPAPRPVFRSCAMGLVVHSLGCVGFSI